jgi:hypothetical protein
MALYSDLITTSEFELESEDFADFDLADTGTLAALGAIISDVTAIIEGHLDRRLIVRPYTIYANYEDWTYDPARALWWMYAPQWPAVEVDTAGVTIGRSMNARETGDILLYASRYQGAIVYYAGYRRSDQDLTELQAESGLSTLGTLPDALPYDLRSAAIEACMYKLYERRHGPGTSTRQINPAVQSTTIQGPRVSYLNELLMGRLGYLRRMAA